MHAGMVQCASEGMAKPIATGRKTSGTKGESSPCNNPDQHSIGTFKIGF